MANDDDEEWPECDPEYIKALGRAVFNFAVLESFVVWIIARFNSSYLSECTSNEKTAGHVARDFADVVRGAKGHTADAELTALSKIFSDLKERRNKLLHGNPALFVYEGRVSYGLHHQARDIWWDVHTVWQAATDFAAAAERAQRLLNRLI
jgi:hypothetical protein